MKIEKAEIISILDQMIQDIERRTTMAEFTLNASAYIGNKETLFFIKRIRSQVEALSDQSANQSENKK